MQLVGLPGKAPIVLTLSILSVVSFSRDYKMPGKVARQSDLTILSWPPMAALKRVDSGRSLRGKKA